MHASASPAAVWMMDPAKHFLNSKTLHKFGLSAQGRIGSHSLHYGRLGKSDMSKESAKGVFMWALLCLRLNIYTVVDRIVFTAVSFWVEGNVYTSYSSTYVLCPPRDRDPMGLFYINRRLATNTRYSGISDSWSSLVNSMDLYKTGLCDPLLFIAQQSSTIRRCSKKAK
jgi:hypothetical protein